MNSSRNSGRHRENVARKTPEADPEQDAAERSKALDLRSIPQPELGPAKLSVKNQRKSLYLILGICLVLLFLLLNAENAFRPVEPGNLGQTLLFFAISSLVFLAFLTLLILLGRNILKLYVDQRSRALGSRLRTRMMIGAILLSFVPTFFMFLFSYLLLNRSIDRWFSQPISELRDDSDRIGQELSHYGAANARAEASSLASEPEIVQALQSPQASDQKTANQKAANQKANDQKAADQKALLAAIARHTVTLQDGFAVVYSGGKALAEYGVPAGMVELRPWSTMSTEPLEQPDPVRPGTMAGTPGTAPGTSGDALAAIPSGSPEAANLLLHGAERTDEPTVAIHAPHSAAGVASPQTDFALGATHTSGGGVVVVGLPMPAGLPATIARIHAGAQRYHALVLERRGIRATYMTMLLLLTVLVAFASSWLALQLSRQVTRPMIALGDAMEEIAAGRYGHRVESSAQGELADLVGSFNLMAADLENSRIQLENSTAQLSDANRKLETRRREIETVLDTIPAGVATLSSAMEVVDTNHAFDELLLPDGRKPAAGSGLNSFFPEDVIEEIQRLARRSLRMGIAASEFALRTQGRERQGRELNVTATVAAFAAGREHRGYVLVIEDVTELLRAQKQVAWKEVAQRVAHEIKNPLTPIALSAERIRRYVDRGTLAESSSNIRDASMTISNAVESLRSLVDEFAMLARFPTSTLRPADVNSMVEKSLSLFRGRLENIRMVERLGADLPKVMADPDVLQRAIANLIDNAAEAMEHSLLRELHITTELSPDRGRVDIAVADSGSGLTEQMHERLFLPYFSTKQRGTGLGLAIASKIVQEHHGFIRAEKNEPAGARFVIELPVAEMNGHSNGNGAANATSSARLQEAGLQDAGLQESGSGAGAAE